MKILGHFLEIFYRFTKNYGISIILLTIFAKVAVLPLALNQVKAMKKNKEINPKIKEIQEKYKNDKEKKNLEIANLYKEHKLNPMSSCITSLMQPLIIFSLYWVIKKPIIYIMGVDYSEVWRIVRACNEWATSYIKNNGNSSKSIEMLNDLSIANFGIHEIEIARQMFLHPEILKNEIITPNLFKNITLINFNFLGMDLSSTPNFISVTNLFFLKWKGNLNEIMLLTIPFFSGITTYFSNKLTLKQSQNTTPNSENIDVTNSMNSSMKWLAPILSAWITFSTPAGLGIYWIISNLFQIVQQFFIEKFFSNGKDKKIIKAKAIETK
jgi:YidC/Oxa1 family membrane protein insertase